VPSLARFAGLLPEPGDLHSAANSKLGKDRYVQVPSRLRKLSLRSRVTLLFLATGLLASLSLSAVSYVSARSYLLERRTEIVERQSFNNAQLIRTQLRTRRSQAFELISGIRTEQNGFSVLHLAPEDLYFSQDIRYTQQVFPPELVASTLAGATSRQRFSIDGQPYIAVGVYIAEINATYFEAFPLTNEQRTLNAIGSALFLGIIIAGALSSLGGVWASRRLMKPLERVSEAASEIADGGLDARLDQEDDPDLSRLVASFNGRRQS
jgi:two-component system, OmpR family, sensor histidine kinase MtrB